MTLFRRTGFENAAQLVVPAGHVSVSPVRLEDSTGECNVLVMPADCGHDASVVPGAVPPGSAQAPLLELPLPGGELLMGVPMLCVSTPEEARLSLLAMVLLMMVTLSESWSEMPAPSQPATLLTMMLLVISTLFHNFGCVGKVETSVPLTCCRRMPPPLP